MADNNSQQEIADHRKTQRKDDIAKGIQEEHSQDSEKDKGKTDPGIKSI